MGEVEDAHQPAQKQAGRKRGRGPGPGGGSVYHAGKPVAAAMHSGEEMAASAAAGGPLPAVSEQQVLEAVQAPVAARTRLRAPQKRQSLVLQPDCQIYNTLKATAVGLSAPAVAGPPAAAAAAALHTNQAGARKHLPPDQHPKGQPSIVMAAAAAAPTKAQPPAADGAGPAQPDASQIPATPPTALLAGEVKLQWGPGAAAQNLAGFEKELQRGCLAWSSKGGSADTATLLGALLHALKLTQPWEQGLEGLAAGEEDAADAHPPPENHGDTPTCSSSMTPAGKAGTLIQGSAALTLVWPVALEMIRAGYLNQLFIRRMSQLCYYQGRTQVLVDLSAGRGSTCNVHPLVPPPGATFDWPMRVVKCYDLHVRLSAADQEVHTMQLATSKACRYVLGLEGVALISRGRHCLQVGLVMPRALDSLWDKMRGRCGFRDEDELRPQLFQVLLGVHELHTHDIWHRDLSPGNFLSTSASDDAPISHDGLQLMVADLGASKVLHQVHTKQSMSVVHTPGFGAPEYLAAATQGGKNLAKGGRRRYQMPGSRAQWPKADMWSVGVVAAYMWCGHVPTGLDDDELNCTPEGLLAVLLGACAAAGCDLPHDPEEESYPPPDGLLQLMVGCLAKDPSQRLSAQQLLRMPWFEQERGQMLYNASQRPASASGSYGVALEALLESWKAQ